MAAKYAIIIPTFNSAGTLAKLLESLELQTYTDFETIVVDDASTDQTVDVVKGYPVRYVRQEPNRGPAACRNLGATLTNAEWLVFADADMVFYPETLATADAVVGSSDADALVGSYAGRPANPGFVPRYKALWEYYIIDRPFVENGVTRVAYNTWAPRPGLVRRNVFEQVGGFDTRFRGADLEDVDLGYRIVEQGFKIYLVPGIAAKHHYPQTLKKELRAFARRCTLWMGMNSSRRKMDKAGEGSPRIALAHLAGFGAFNALLLGVLWVPFAILGLALLAAYAALHGPFAALAWKEGGAAFAAGCLALCWLHSIVLGFSAGWGLLKRAAGRGR